MANPDDLLAQLINTFGVEKTRQALIGQGFTLNDPANTVNTVIEWIGQDEALRRLDVLALDNEEYDPDDAEYAKRFIEANSIQVAFDPDPKLGGWGISWAHGTMTFGGAKLYSREDANKVATLFAHLWKKGVDAGLARDLAVCFQRVRYEKEG